MLVESFIINGLIAAPINLLGEDTENGAPIYGIERHRLLTDGKGVTSLVGFCGCPLNCKYCINPECHDIRKSKQYSPQSLYELLKVDDLYFQATGGGVVFGGGEPCLYSDFIFDFKSLCGSKWKIGIETSLNVSNGDIEKLKEIVDEWIIDIKDMNREIYKRYTGMPNEDVVKNIEYLVANINVDSITIRIPLIPNYNSEEKIMESKRILERMGLKKIDIFEYVESVNGKCKGKATGKYGKAVCEVLKEIRKEIATANKINISISDCPHGKCLTGSCPVCDNEARKIMEELNRKQINNEQIYI